VEDIRSGYLADAAKYYKGEPHQLNAWGWLQGNIDSTILKQFEARYSPTNPPATESIRPKFDPTNIDWSNTNARVSEYFTVLEVTKGDARRIPDRGSSEEKNIIALARELDKVRKAFGHPIGITSWYRPPAINRAVGGVSNSQHINGCAADIYPLSGMDIDDFQTWLDSVWFGALGYGAKKGFVHLDIRNGRGYLSGGDKGVRWNY
jgi:putative chitinase